MGLSILTDNREMIIAFLAAFSAFAAIVVVSWPYLAQDTFGARMRQVADERERIRVRERARMDAGEKKPVLRVTPDRLLAGIVRRLKLAGQAEDGNLVRTLRRAGYRGQAPVITYVVIRSTTPFIMLGIALSYAFFFTDQSIVVQLGIGLAAALVGYYFPALYVKNRIAKRQKAIRRAWPDALDLLLICVESGMSIDNAFHKVAEEIGTQSIELAEELSLTTAELSYLEDRRKAYENLGERTDLEGVRAVVTSLTQAEKYGTALGQSLRVTAQENRDMRMSLAEKKAAGLGPKLTVPMILFFLPVLFAIILTPAIIQIMAS